MTSIDYITLFILRLDQLLKDLNDKEIADHPLVDALVMRKEGTDPFLIIAWHLRLPRDLVQHIIDVERVS